MQEFRTIFSGSRAHCQCSTADFLIETVVDPCEQRPKKSGMASNGMPPKQAQPSTGNPNARMNLALQIERARLRLTRFRRSRSSSGIVNRHASGDGKPSLECLFRKWELPGPEGAAAGKFSGPCPGSAAEPHLDAVAAVFADERRAEAADDRQV